MNFVTLAFGICAYAANGWAWAGTVQTVDGKPTCEVIVGADGPNSHMIMTVEINGHQVSVGYMDNDQADVIIDGKHNRIGAPI